MIIKGNETLTFAIVWTDPENPMLRERSQMRKVTWYMIPFISSFKNRRLYRYRKLISGCQGQEGAGR